MIYLASNLKHLRVKKNKTQDDVASVLGLKRSTLSGYESGVALPPIDIIIKLAEYYQLTIDTLIKVNLTLVNDFELRKLKI